MAVRIQENGNLFATLAEATSAAQLAGFNTFTLEVISDIAETSDVIINANVTIIGTGGAHTVTLLNARRLYVEGGGSLSLGDGGSANTLTILAGIRATNGMVNIRQGIIVQNNSGTALQMIGPSVIGSISGGRLAGGAIALSMENGAQISEISGGEFAGGEDAIFLSGAGTMLHRISNGAFYQTNPNTTLQGHAVFVDNSAQIGIISGGYFEAARNNALAITRGGWVGEIGGGEFFAKRVGSSAENNRNATVGIEGATALTGIGTISGGNFGGGYFGLLAIRRDFQAQINSISGGVFAGLVALENDVGSIIGEISGGVFTGNQGLFNNGRIGIIGGDAEIRGTASSAGYGIYNYNNGQIDEISGATILSDMDNAIMNAGLISLISGGAIIGWLSAISCIGLNRGRLETILDGVFWGKNAAAIMPAYSLALEPGLHSVKGLGQYWGKDGVIFNDESLVVYPYNYQFGAYYRMSDETEPVPGLPGVEFKYLVLDADVYTVTVLGSFAGDSGSGLYLAGDTVTINAGSRDGYIFTGWVVNTGGVTLADATSPLTTFIMPATDVTVTAQYEPVIIQPVPIVIQAKKIVCGAAIQPGMFTFVLCDKNGREVARATNDSNGEIIFLLEAITQAGVHCYSLREFNSPGCGWVTDTRCFSVIVIVKDNGLGQLITDIRYPDGKPVFVNYYFAKCFGKCSCSC